MKRTEYQKRWYKENRDRILKRARTYYQENKEKLKASGREYHRKNRTKRLAAAAIYRESHLEELRENARKYYAEKKIVRDEQKRIAAELELQRRDKENPIDKRLGIRWLAGLLEGEGSFSQSGVSIRIDLKMTDKDVIEQAIIEVRDLIGFWPKLRMQTMRANWKTQYGFYLYADRAKKLMALLQPYMGKRRSARIAELLKM